MDLLGRLTIAFGVDMSDLDSAGGRLKEIGGQFTSLGAIVTAGITLPIAAGGAAALKAAVDFETAMVKIAKTVDGGAEAIAALGEELKALSERTGTSVKELARIGEIAGQMGIAAGDISKFTEIIAALGVATELSTDAAAEGLAKFSNVMGTSIEDIDRLGSALVALGNAGSSSEAQILEMASRVTAAGNQVGLAESEVLAFSSALSDLGIDAEAGGSAISKLFLNMQADVATGGGALKQFAEVAGLTVADFSELFRNDAAKAMQAFVEGLGSMDKRTGEAIVTLDEMGITEVRLRNAVLSLAAGHDVLDKAIKTGATGWAENTALMAEAQKFYDSTGQRLESLKNKAVNVAGELGTALLPALNAFIDFGSKALDVSRVLVEAFSQLPAPIKVGAVAFLALVAAVGPLLIAVGGLITAFGVFVGAAALVGVTFTGVGAAAAAAAGVFLGIPAVLAAVVAAGFAIVKNWGAIKDAAGDLLVAVGTKLTGAWDAVANAARSLAAAVTRQFDALASTARTALSAVAAQLSVLTAPLAHLARSFTDLGNAVADVLGAIAGRVGGVLKPALDLMGSLFLKAVDVVGGALRGLGTLVLAALGGVASAVGNVLGGIADSIGRLLGGALSKLGSLFTGARDVIVAIVIGMVGRILDALKPLGRMVELVADGVDGVTNLFRKAADVIVGHSIVPDMVDDIGRSFGRLEPAMVGPTKKATAGVTTAFAGLNATRPSAALVANVGADFAKLPAVMVAPAEKAVEDVTRTFAAAPPLVLKTEGLTSVFAGAVGRAREISAGLVGQITSDFSGIENAMVKPAQRAAAAVTEAFANIVNPKKINNIDFKVSIDPTQLYASLIAAGQTTSQKLNLIAQASASLTNTFQSQLEAANNEHAVRVAHTAALEDALDRQHLLAIVVGDETLARREGVTAILDSNSRHSHLAATLALAEESTKHLSVAQTQTASRMDAVWAAAGSVVQRAGSNLTEAFSTLKGGVVGLLERFTPLGIAGAVVTRAFEKLEPVIKPFEQIIEILADVLAAALVPILRAMFPIIKLLAIAFTFVGEVVYRVAQGFLLVIGHVVRTIGKLIDALPFVSGKGIINAGQALLDQADAMGDAARAMREARDKLQGLEFDQKEEPGQDQDGGIKKGLEGLLEGIAEQGEQLSGVQASVNEGTAAQKETAAHTQAAEVAIREEAGILTSLRDVAASGFKAVVAALDALVFEAPVVNLTVPDAENAQITVQAPTTSVDLSQLESSAAQTAQLLAALNAMTSDGFRSVTDAVLGISLDVPLLNVTIGEEALAGLSASAVEITANTARTANQAEAAAITSQAETQFLSQSLAVQVEIRDAVRAMTDVLIAKEFSPVINVSVPSSGGSREGQTEAVTPDLGGFGDDDRGLGQGFDMMERYSGKSEF